MKKDSKKDIAISVKNLHKSFKLPHEEHSGVKQAIINTFSKGRKKGYEIQHVLKGLDFEIQEGDFFGIVGRNGSGKSTLLKTLAGIYSPDKGAVVVKGTLVPFIELGVGFNPELTGRENVFLNGALLGFSRHEMEEMYDDIVEFAELKKFMDQKLKNYSSGMQVRLAFSIAIRADGDILLLDEVLAVGDEAFQRKCTEYFYNLKKRKKTVILVTHSMDSVRKFCNKAMMIRDGKVVVYGSPEDVANEYSVENLDTGALTPGDKDKKVKQKPRLIEGLKSEIVAGKKITQEDYLEVRVSYTSLVDTPTKIRLSLQDMDRSVPVLASNTNLTSDKKVEKTFKVTLNAINNSKLKIQVSVRDEEDAVIDFLKDEKCPSVVVQRTDYPNPKKPQKYAILFDRGEWS